ncbi:MAG: polysaccharide deacetylase family protein [Candidatus Saccharibacteria bacterium]|nr:polysaccharide deacetylase family protein [Candidatus Saccharibacteria bacterium]
MQYTILGRLQFITILAVLALPFAALLNKPVHAENSSSSAAAFESKNIDQPYEGATFPDVKRSINSLGDSFIDSLNSARTTSNVDCSLENCIALTFDDGPNQLYTPQVLDILKQYRAYGSFFIIGNRISAHPELVRRAYREGHDIGNHTWSHPMLDKLTPEQINNEYVSTQEAMVRAGRCYGMLIHVTGMKSLSIR